MRAGEEQCRGCAKLGRQLDWEDEAVAPVVPEAPPTAPPWEAEPEPPPPARRRGRRRGAPRPCLDPTIRSSSLSGRGSRCSPPNCPSPPPGGSGSSRSSCGQAGSPRCPSGCRPTCPLQYGRWQYPFSSWASWCRIRASSVRTPPGGPLRANAPARAAAAAPKVITQAMYDQIHKGMTEADAAVLFGRGELMAVGLHGGALRRVVRWPGDGKVGKTVFIAFEDGKAIGPRPQRPYRRVIQVTGLLTCCAPTRFVRGLRHLGSSA